VDVDHAKLNKLRHAFTSTEFGFLRGPYTQPSATTIDRLVKKCKKLLEDWRLPDSEVFDDFKEYLDTVGRGATMDNRAKQDLACMIYSHLRGIFGPLTYGVIAEGRHKKP